MNIHIREIQPTDKAALLLASEQSRDLHTPWVSAPQTEEAFDDFFQRFSQPAHKSYVVLHDNQLVGVFNISEMVRGGFQNAYLGFYAFKDQAGKGYMSAGLKLVLERVFKELKLHRLEANIQPENTRSIELVKKNNFRYEGFSPRYLMINQEWRGHERWAMTYEDYIQDDEDIQQKDMIDIVSYNPDWPNQAKMEIANLQRALPAEVIVDIQHYGSTAISGMSAKPVIDIQIAATSLALMKLIAVPALQKLGYEYWADNPNPERMFFVKGMPPFGLKRTHHVYIVEPTSKHWINKMLFRDYLRAHPEAAKEYQELKIKLANEHAYDREKYTDAKTGFIEKILAIANKTN